MKKRTKLSAKQKAAVLALAETMADLVYEVGDATVPDEKLFAPANIASMAKRFMTVADRVRFSPPLPRGMETTIRERISDGRLFKAFVMALAKQKAKQQKKKVKR